MINHLIKNRTIMKNLLYVAVIMALIIPAVTSCKGQYSRTYTDRISLQVSQDMLDLCDIEATYMDSDSVVKTHKMNGILWAKLIHYHMDSTRTFRINYKMKLKPNVELTKEEYELFANCGISTNYESRHVSDTIINKTVPKDQVVAAINAVINDSNVHETGFGYTINRYKPGRYALKWTNGQTDTIYGY